MRLVRNIVENNFISCNGINMRVNPAMWQYLSAREIHNVKIDRRMHRFWKVVGYKRENLGT